MSLQQLIQEVLVRNPEEKKIIIENEREYTIKQFKRLLESYVIYIRKLLVNLELSEPQVIGVQMEPCFERVVAILAIVCIGSAFIPLNTDMTEDISKVIKETNVKVILRKGRLYLQYLIQSDVTIVDVQNIEADDAAVDFPPPKPEGDPLFCVMYTSGSTGRSKGVMLHSHNILNRLTWYWRQFPFKAHDVGCHRTSVMFIDGITEMFTHLLQGVPMLVVDKATARNAELFLREIHKHKVTRIVVVPSLLQAMIQINHTCKSHRNFEYLEQITCSGETLRPALAKQVLETTPEGCILNNFYGSTETTGDVTFHTFYGPEDIDCLVFNGSIPIGTPIANTNVYLLDKEMSPVKGHEIGDIYISGSNVARGYISNQGLEDFVVRPDGEVLYRMGDCGFKHCDKLYITGRTDSQIKVRGRKVNLAEIETTIQDIPFIEKAILVACEDSIADCLVPVAFITTGKTDDLEMNCTVSPEVFVRETCAKKLGDHAVPVVFRVNNFPLLPNTGKVDKQTLKQWFSKRRQLAQNAKVGNDCDVLLSVLAQVTGTPYEVLALGGSFLALGGNSVSAATAVMKLHDAGIHVCVAHLLSCDSILTVLQTDTQIAKMCSPSEAQYQVIPVSETTDRESLVKMVAREFTMNPHAIALGETEEYLVESAQDIVAEAIDGDKLASVIINHASKQIVACVILFDLAAPDLFYFENTDARRMRQCVEKEILEELLSEKDSKWLYFHSLVVDSTKVADRDKWTLLRMLEEEALQIAKRRGYTGIFTCNTNPVTMLIEERDFGYQTLNTFQMCTFEIDGRLPFKDMSEDIILKLMLKVL